MKSHKLPRSSHLIPIIASAAAVLCTPLYAHQHLSHEQRPDSGRQVMDHATHMAALQHPPSLPGEAAFGAIQEIVALLEADPNTDWTKVNLRALRDHLVDMHRLVMDTEVEETPIDGGLAMTVRGRGDSIGTIQRMIPAHSTMINGLNDWKVRWAMTPDGASLMVSADSSRETEHIRGLGFYGLMATGAHHQAHHIGIARGEHVHGQ